jgi:hypothetical protein
MGAAFYRLPTIAHGRRAFFSATSRSVHGARLSKSGMSHQQRDRLRSAADSTAMTSFDTGWTQQQVSCGCRPGPGDRGLTRVS